MRLLLNEKFIHRARSDAFHQARIANLLWPKFYVSPKSLLRHSKSIPPLSFTMEHVAEQLRQIAAVVDPSVWGSVCIQDGSSVRVALRARARNERQTRQPLQPETSIRAPMGQRSD